MKVGKTWIEIVLKNNIFNVKLKNHRLDRRKCVLAETIEITHLLIIVFNPPSWGFSPHGHQTKSEMKTPLLIVIVIFKKM